MAKKTFLEIQKQIQQLQKEADQLRKNEANDVLSRIKEAIEVYGFTAADLGVERGAGRAARGQKIVKRGGKAASRASSSVPKYRDQEGNVWSGRGPRPAWFKAALEAGTSADALLAK